MSSHSTWFVRIRTSTPGRRTGLACECQFPSTEASMGVPPLFSTRTESRNGVARIALSGELDMSTVRFMAESLARFENDGVGAIILDLRELTFLDSAGLHAFLQARDRASKNGHRLVMVGASHQARRVFELTGTGFLLDGQDAVSVLHQFAGGTSGNGQARPAEGDAGG